MTNDPLMFSLQLTERDNKQLQKYISRVMEEGDPVENDITKRKEGIM